MKTNKATSEKMDLLLAIEQIVEQAKDSSLDNDFFKKAAKPIKYVSDKLDLTKEQSVFIALFVDNVTDDQYSLRDMARQLGCSTTKLLRLMNDVDELERRELVCRSNSNRRAYYHVPTEVINAFRKNEKYIPEPLSELSCKALFAEFENIFEQRSDEDISYDMAMNKILFLLDNNKHLIFVQKVKSLGLNDYNTVLLVLFSHLFVTYADDNFGFRDLQKLYDNNREARRMWSLLQDNKHVLQNVKILEFSNDGGFVNKESIRFTWNAKQTFFQELNLSSLNKEVYRKSLVKHDTITPKQLFFENDIQKQVIELGNLLKEENYRNICVNLKNHGYRCGFTCLFYGAPGTGKTETVLQLAKQTGRDIMRVNVSEIKSMWVGESEKNIKRLFDQYREMVEKSPITPILLFNEADAIINKRQEGAEHAVDKMENAIQNIILQEMETLDGIMIATTNLAGNMDKAFERRFLYKIKFNKPSIEARKNIWTEMIPSLNDNDATMLASKYDFSGGQIENIARHYTIDSILHIESSVSLATLLKHCDNEKIEHNESRTIGFKI